MGLMDDVIAADAAVFSDPDLMPGVESIVITFNDATTRTVNAQVFRGEPVPFGDGYRPGILISFRNHATLGLLPSEIDGGGVVRVTVARNYGETAAPLLMRRATDPDKGGDSGRLWVEVG
jgi:hypothetical protein